MTSSQIHFLNKFKKEEMYLTSHPKSLFLFFADRCPCQPLPPRTPPSPAYPTKEGSTLSNSGGEGLLKGNFFFGSPPAPQKKSAKKRFVVFANLKLWYNFLKSASRNKIEVLRADSRPYYSQSYYAARRPSTVARPFVPGGALRLCRTLQSRVQDICCRQSFTPSTIQDYLIAGGNNLFHSRQVLTPPSGYSAAAP